MSRSLHKLLLVMVGICLSPGLLMAQYEYSFPDQNVDTFEYSYPQMKDAGDRVVGFRSTPDIPSVNYLDFSIGFDGNALENCDAQVRFFFDDIFLGYAILAAESDFFYTFAGTVVFRPDQVVDTRDHEIIIELITDLGAPGCGEDYFTVDVEDSFIIMDLIDADIDGDGAYSDLYYGDDCDDDDPSVYLDAIELCDGKDNDCDGFVDEEVETTFYPDSDSDSYGDGDAGVLACAAPDGYVGRPGDCNDDDGDIYPGAPELCDEEDNDCDGDIDEGATGTYYEDADGDTYGNPSSTTQACTTPNGYVGRPGDCDDTDDTVYSNADELCDEQDNDCDGTTDEGVTSPFYTDGDDDGFGAGSPIQACSAPNGTSSVSGDCDDAEPNTYPGAEELCDGEDNDCDGTSDEGVTTTYYEDDDGDGFGSSTSTQACSLPEGYATQGGDCDDDEAGTYPGASEACDGIDNDCDGDTDEGVLTTFYRDRDGDAYGSIPTSDACVAPRGYSALPGDCDDTDSTVYPEAPELCDEQDNDCDEVVDEGVESIFYGDSDGDDHGVPSVTTSACQAPDGFASLSDDCDDSDASVYPGAPELCDEQDNDCDETIDEGIQDTVYGDNDGDGWGDEGDTLDTCEGAVGYVGRPGDCDDGDSTVYPGAPELCDGQDNDCDGQSDEGVQDTYYGDGDNDGWGVEETTTQACSTPEGYADLPGDCDDSNENINPDATEVCNGEDDDCDGQSDEGVETTYYPDGDSDGYGTTSGSVMSCERPGGFAGQSGDCDDDREDVYPGAEEACDGVDNDCDGQSDEGVTGTFYVDQDADGFGGDISLQACEAGDGLTSETGDCDDSDPAINPDATEVCDGADNDCDGESDEGVGNTYYGDGDGDGFGEDGDTTEACSRPTGYVTAGGDCDDSRDDIYPEAQERCDGADNDCDGDTDEGVTSTYYGDSDGDSYGDGDDPIQACGPGEGLSGNGSDCDDEESAVNPGATEICNGIDDNCNGDIDENTLGTFYQDADGDSYGTGSVSQEACAAPNGYVSASGDCNDNDASTNPGASERCDGADNDCDGPVDEGVLQTFYADTDADTFGDENNPAQACSRPNGYVGLGGDCDDDNPGVNPNADEACDGVDQDCDSFIDEGVTSSIFADADGDTFGDPSSEVLGCAPGEGEVLNGRDCDDTEASVYPGAAEICGDGIDQNCNGADQLCGETDGDGDGVTPTEGDCDDDDNTTYPGAEELCDEADNDCDGTVDERDIDGDGFIDSACGGDDCDDNTETTYPGAEELCDGVDNDCSGGVDDRDVDEDGYIASECGGDDCDDADPRVNPGEGEVCDGLDNDCNGTIDDIDADGDSYDAATCEGDDCDDTNPDIYPGAEENPEDGIDNDCDGDIDEGGDSFDDDGDGYTEGGGDCDDEDPEVNPGAEEDPEDGIDNDCDGEIDETGEGSPTPTADTTPSGSPTPTVGLTPTPTADTTPTGGDTPTADTTPTGGDTPTADTTPSDASPTETSTSGGENPGEEGCACRSAPGSTSIPLEGLLLLGLGALLRRRRR